MEITNAKNAKTLSPSHMKQCILSESRFDFLKDLVKNIPDINNEDNIENTSTNNSNSSPTTPITGGSNSFETSLTASALLSTISSSTSKVPHHQTPSATAAIPHCSNQMKEIPNKTSTLLSPPPLVPHNSPYNTLSTSYSANFYTEQHPSTTTPSISSLTNPPVKPPTPSVIQYNTTIVGASSSIVNSNNGPPPQPIFHIAIKNPDDTKSSSDIPPLIPIMQHSDINLYNFSSNNDNLCTDDDYDN